MNENLMPSRGRRCGINRPRRVGDILDIRNMFDDFWSNNLFAPIFAWSNEVRSDICETDSEYIIEAELPGVRKEDIKVDLKDDIITIRVDNEEILSEEGKNYIRKERRYGSQSRSYYLTGIQQDAIKAKFDNGVLTLTLPKTEDKNKNIRKIDIE